MFSKMTKNVFDPEQSLYYQSWTEIGRLSADWLISANRNHHKTGSNPWSRYEYSFVWSPEEWAIFCQYMYNQYEFESTLLLHFSTSYKERQPIKASPIDFPTYPGQTHQIKINIKQEHIKRLHYSARLRNVPDFFKWSIFLQDSWAACQQI